MKNAFVRLEEYYLKASDIEKIIIKFLLNNNESAIGMTIGDVAQKTYSSQATVFRLCKKLGFDGYRDFQRSYSIQSSLEREKINSLERNISKNDVTEVIIQKITDNSIVALKNSANLLDYSMINKVVQLLKQSSVIFLFGLGSSLLVARDAYLKFLRLNKNCQLSDEWHSQLLQAKNISSNDVAIIVSYSGLTPEMIKCAKIINRNHAPIILISRFNPSPLSELATYHLPVSNIEPIFRSGAMSSRVSQLNVIDILYASYIHNDESLLSRFKKTYISKEGVKNNNEN